MSKLFLSSSFKDVVSVFARFAGDTQGKRVTFIPTASLVEKVIFYVKSGRKALEELGMLVDELDVSTAAPEEIAGKLAANDYIYVSGGNTFFLLQELKRSGADKMIAEQVRAGKLYIGESAGAMVASPDIAYASVMDSVKKAPLLGGFDSLHLTDFYTVPHHGNAPFKKAVEKIIEQYGASLALRPISNKEAVLVDGDTVNTTL